ncbi:MAG: hypothetical protein KA133_01220 [Flavobacterium sp.]|nr:hypothetical protein [Flavobacterium sp.]
MDIYTYRTKGIIFILLLFTVNLFSQNLDKIKKADTIYILFKNKIRYQEHYVQNINTNKTKYDDYFFLLSSWYPINLEFHHFYTQEERKEKKSFLKKNKDIIVTYAFLTKFTLGEVTELIGNKKKVYLIDDNDIGWFKIKLKEVKVIGILKPSLE